MLTPVQLVLVFLAAAGAGVLNAVAGGGSFLTFPTLLFVGIPSIRANATNTIALWPGVVAGIGAYLKEVRSQVSRLIPMGIISMLGGGIGAWLLLHIQETTFSHMIPYLMLIATAIFASSGVINGWLRSQNKPALAGSLWAILIFQFLIAIYGGFFGGGIGIMMLALLSVSGFENMNRMNAVKLTLNALINGVAVIMFIAAGAVEWAAAVVMIVGAILGGYGGARLAQRVDQKWVRRFVVGVGTLLTVYFFFKYA